MTYRAWILCVALLGFALAGCQAHNNFQKKWPKYPHWGWWKHPAEDVSEPVEDPSADEAESDSLEGAPRKPATLEEHRAVVWEKVAVLRDVDELPPAQQRQLIESARQDLRKWYRPMSVEPPDPNDPRWITVLVWDFMPEEDFEQAAENWRQTAREKNLPFPQDVTRRELMDFVAKITSGELKPATKKEKVKGKAK